jgi:hypothetical protein
MGIIRCFIFTSDYSLVFTRNSIFDFLIFTEKTGVIGDTIGGITAPFLNLAAAVLVYLSFSQQMEANKIQFNALKEDKAEKRDTQLMTLSDNVAKELESDLANIKTSNLVGTDALDTILELIISNSNLNITNEVDKFRKIKAYIGKNILLLTQIENISNPFYKELYYNKYIMNYHINIWKYTQRTIYINSSDNDWKNAIQVGLHDLIQMNKRISESLKKDELSN